MPVRIGDTLTEGNLDTGANVSFVLPGTLFDRIGGGAVQSAGEGKLTNTVVSTGKAMVKGPFRIGAVSLSDVEVRVSDRYPELLVGAHALQHFTLLSTSDSKGLHYAPARHALEVMFPGPRLCNGEVSAYR